MSDEKPMEWRCFHCDEVFTDYKLAADHFGPERDEGWEAACVDPLRTDEKERRAELVSAVEEMQRAQNQVQQIEEQFHNACAEIGSIPQYFGKDVTTVWLAGDRYKSALNLIDALKATNAELGEAVLPTATDNLRANQFEILECRCSCGRECGCMCHDR